MKFYFILKMFRFKEVQIKFADIFRVFISGSSSAGKTYFAQKFLHENLFNFKRIYYFHPDFHETAPVNWPFDVVFHAGLPSLDDLLAIPEHSCLIFDDLYHECVGSSEIDYLYRVLSSKRKLHCFIMTQRYFAQGKFALNIRNSSNYHILMRNADERTNIRAADTMNLKREILKANQCNEKEMYPYIFIDRTCQARVTGIKVYIDIFSKQKKVIMQSKLFYLIADKDFKARFKTIDDNIAVEHETQKRKVQEPTKVDSKAQKSINQRNQSRRDQSESSIQSSSSSQSVSSDDEPPRKRSLSRRELARRVRQAVQRRKERSFF